MKPRYLGQSNSPSSKFLLDRILRQESRKDFSKYKAYGLDIWNAYEFAYLLNDKPKIVVLEISIPADSKYTIESKSMKLFLNSFFNNNYAKQAEVLNILTKRISKQCYAKVKIVTKSSFKNFDRDYLNKKLIDYLWEKNYFVN